MPLAAHTLDLIWDLTRERPTLGGALVLRQEGELLAHLHGDDRVTLRITGPTASRGSVLRLYDAVFASSHCDFQLTGESESTETWPAIADRQRAGFSYFSFSRLLGLHQEHGIKPRLQWHPRILQLARQARARFRGRLICLHLRSVAPFTHEESNADGAAWQTFLSAQARAGVTDFILLGDDPLPAGLIPGTGVTPASDLGLDLATQLALVGCADGFLGMASGLCTAANLSSVPHVIFKHPAHHPVEMQRELGDTDRFPFAESNQRLWRRGATVAALHEAFALISP